MQVRLHKLFEQFLHQTGNALARVQRVHEPVDLWDITFCTRRSKFLTHALSDDALLNHSNDVYKHCSVYTGQSVLCGDAIVVLTKPLCIQTIEHDYCLFQERFLPTILWWWCNFS